MATYYNVGDRVTVSYPRWDGEGVVIQATRVVSGRPITIVQMETGKMAKQSGGFEDNALNSPLPVSPRKGDRVKVTVYGTVQSVNSKVGVLPDGSVDSGYSGNYFDPKLEGVTVEVLEPTYEAGTLVRDSNGAYFQRNTTQGWWKFGSSTWFRHDVPARPLTIIVGEK